MAETKKLSAGDFAHLETVRGIAALYVVLNHARGYLWSGYQSIKDQGLQLGLFEKAGVGINMFTSLGHEAVILFFIVSGFSIAYSLRINNDYWGFQYRRFLRLYPPYAGSIVLVMGVMAAIVYLCPEWFASADTAPFHKALQNVWATLFDWKELTMWSLYLKANSATPQFWSLIYEWIFYLLVPIFMLRRNWYYWASGLLFLAGIYLLNWQWNDEKVLIEYFFRYNFYFVLGILLLFQYETIRSYVLRLKKWQHLLLMPALFVMMVAVKLVLRDNNHLNEILSAVLAYLMVVYFLEYNPRMGFFEKIGELSYSLYLTHYIVIIGVSVLLYKMFGVAAPYTNPFVWLVALPFCIATGYGMFLLTEKPTRALLSRIRKRNLEKKTSVPAG